MVIELRIGKAHELGEMIKASKEMEVLNIAEKLQAEDSEAQELIADFNIKRLNLAREIQSGKITEEDAIKKNNDAFSEMVEKSHTFSRKGSPVPPHLRQCRSTSHPNNMPPRWAKWAMPS